MPDHLLARLPQGSVLRIHARGRRGGRRSRVAPLPRRARRRHRRLSPWLVLAIGLGASAALWLLLVVALLAFRRKDVARDLAMFIPDCVILVKRLLADERVPQRAKLVLIALFVYLALT